MNGTLYIATLLFAGFLTFMAGYISGFSHAIPRPVGVDFILDRN